MSHVILMENSSWGFNVQLIAHSWGLVELSFYKIHHIVYAGYLHSSDIYYVHHNEGLQLRR